MAPGGEKRGKSLVPKGQASPSSQETSDTAVQKIFPARTFLCAVSVVLVAKTPDCYGTSTCTVCSFCMGLGWRKRKEEKKSGCSIEFKLLDTRRTRRLTTIAMSYVICADKLWNTSQLALAKCSIYISFPPLCICVVC